MIRSSKWLMFLLVILTAWMATSCSALSSASRGDGGALRSFDYRGVALEGGRLGEQYEQVKKNYLAISNDSILKSYRRKANLPAPGPDMGGWYDTGTFNIFGQLLSGLARFYAGSGDAACKEKADFLIHEWAKTISPNGSFFNTPNGSTPHYVYEKMVGGLVDNYIYCGNEEARERLSQITDWAMKTLPRNHSGWNSEWYTLGENLYRAYLATGEKKYLDYAKVWEYSSYWSRFSDKVPGEDLFTDPPKEEDRKIGFHAYSHVNTFSSAAAAFEVTHDDRYRRIITNAYDYLQNNQVFATGGYGPIEALMEHNGLVNSLDAFFIYKHFETQCGSWAAFKMSKYLTRFNGDDRYGDWVERLAYNGIGASLPAEGGHVQYDSDYHAGGAWKQNTVDPWTCCAGTRSEAIADYVDQIYFHNDNNIYVNLFTPSAVRWGHDGTTVTLRQSTRFPEQDSTELTVSVPQSSKSTSGRFGICLRSPGWVAAPPSGTINGKRVKLKSLSTGWLMVERKWSDGDKLRVTFPMKLEWDTIDAQKPYPGAMRYGPVVLAIGSSGPSPAKNIDPKNLSASLLPVEGQPLHYRLASAPSLTARPFYEFGKKERYFIYLDPKYTNQVSLHDFQFHGKWFLGTSSEAGAWAECQFEGDKVRWTGRHADDGGQAEVRVDDKLVATVDQYKQGSDSKYSWEATNLAPGKHTIRITVLPQKNAESKRQKINIAGLEVH